MNRRRALAALTLTAGLLLPVACAGPATTDVSTIDANEIDDCDRGDRRKKEIPDCGRKVNGKYVEWSWVKAGKKKPPTDWTPASG